MKVVLILTLLLGYMYSITAQEALPVVRALKEGDTLPDYLMGKVINNTTGKSSFAAFRGKWLLLVSWNTYCGACIAAWPKEEKLQEQFKDNIQIILFNALEDEQQISARLKRINKTLPQLPTIVKDTILSRLFPSKSVGVTTWVNPEGIIVTVNANGVLMNREENIALALQGRKVNFLPEGSKEYRGESLFSFAYARSKAGPIYASGFFPFLEEFGGKGGGVRAVIDSATGTRRRTVVNENIVNLLLGWALKNTTQEYRNKRIIGPRLHVNPILELLSLDVKDTIRYVNQLMDLDRYDHEQYRLAHISYEQCVLMELSDSEWDSLMLADLKAYLYSRYKAAVTVNKKTISAFVLVNVPGSSLVLPNEPLTKKYNASDDKSYSLISAVESMVLSNNSDGVKFFFNEAGVSKSELLSVIVPMRTKGYTITTLNKALESYNLEFVRSEVEIPQVLISEK